MLRTFFVKNSAIYLSSFSHFGRIFDSIILAFIYTSCTIAFACTRETGGEHDMAIKLINIGFGNIVSANRIISIVSPESAPIKRIIQEARDRHMLIDATYGTPHTRCYYYGQRSRYFIRCTAGDGCASTIDQG